MLVGRPRVASRIANSWHLIQINIAFQILGVVTALILTCFCRYENRRRDAVEGGKPPKGENLDLTERFDLSPGFRYVV